MKRLKYSIVFVVLSLVGGIVPQVDVAAQDRDPNRTRLLLMPTARSMESGSAFASVNGLFFPFVGAGIRDVAFIGGGISIVPASSEQIYYIVPKITFYNRNRLSLAVGSLFAGITGNDGNGGIAFGVGTYGTEESALTLGSGFLFGGGRFSESPVIMIGGEHRITETLKLLTENYIFTQIPEALIFSLGIRFGSKQLAADFGLFTAPELVDESGLPFLPWFSFTYNFTY